MANDVYDPDNIFAKIIRGEIPALKVLDDIDAVAFMDIMPWSDGHTLVVPKVPVRNLFEAPPDTLAILIQRVQRVAHAVQYVFKPDGLRIVQNNEAAAGQTVFHLHFHIVPCYTGVPLRIGDAVMADQAVLRDHADRLRKAIALRHVPATYLVKP